ncbi:helix-turn-helix domain-containing protein [Leuconostoc gasicomitatum]|uniref:Helix-turn-helix transcriptional regulator n=1 Tax=Leuconostoc gasicomitatum TaxID=115778 RepID=A0A9Q3SX95_9LACO|nr:helix-turn-helix transcriptional regulator [Leuconostoc gasicomitatum]MBZ5961764.1 helix-turn-helix transcriptional regulator [Leuconostoc gasicomitatum]
MLIGEKIKIIREDRKISQEQMARSLNVSGQAVSNWERGKGYPDISNIIRLSEIYDISLDELIREDKNYKEVLLEKKIGKTVDNIFNVGLLLTTIIVLLYGYITHGFYSHQRFYIIFALVMIIDIGIYVYKQVFGKNTQNN